MSMFQFQISSFMDSCQIRNIALIYVMNMPSITLILSVNIPACEFHDSDSIRLSSISVQSRWIQATFKLKSKCLRVNMPTLEFRIQIPIRVRVLEFHYHG